MSTPEQSKETKPAPGGKGTGIKPERVIVRLVMGVLLALTLVELVAYSRLLLVHRQFLGQIQKAEVENHRITKDVVTKIFGGREPDESKEVKAAVGMERYDIYYFAGLLKQRPLCIHYGVAGLNSEPEVIGVETNIPDAVLAAK